jgi:L-lactate dehydrogenase complex protein LldE
VKASLFVTCLTDLFYPRVAVAMVRVLRRLGVEVDFPEGQTCCGQPAFNSGFEDDARAVAARMIDVFETSEAVVTPSGSCAAMVREHFEHLFEHDPRMLARARALADKTFDFVEFLDKKLDVDWPSWSLTGDEAVTFHYSCHLRGLGMTTEAVDVLKRIDGVDYRPLDDLDQCCGFGGTFAVKFGDISAAMAREKVRRIAETGADVLMCNDGGCAMNIAGACRRQGVDVTVKHIAELLDEAMSHGSRTE